MFLPVRLLEDVETGLLVADARLPDMPIVYLTSGAARITGYDHADLIGKNCRFLQGAERDQPQIQVMRKALLAGYACKVTLQNFRKDGSAFWNEVRLMPLYGPNDVITHYAAMLADVTASSDALLAAKWNARFDPRTGLLNRQGAIDELTTMLAVAPKEELSVAVIQAAGLLEIANTIGEDGGDTVLRVATDRLTSLPSVAWAARLPFGRLLMIIKANHHDAILAVLRSALDVLEKPYVFFETNFTVTATCGYTLLEGRVETAANLVREASVASTGARDQGPGSIHRFNQATDKVIKSRLRLLSDLQTAIRDDELVLFYQPKIDLKSGAILGAEALLRWQHGLFGTQQPARFLPIAEKSNMIVEIGRQSLIKAARFAARINQGRTEYPLPIAVNISPTHFMRDNFVSELRTLLADNRAQPEWISIELIETVLAEATPRMIRNFAELREMGIGIAVDDFGVGYSNLTYLRDFPLTELKIDQTFIRDLESRPANATIVRAIAGLAREFGLKIVAEGVETKAEHEAIVGLGCHLGQGYYYSVPLEGEALLEMLARETPLPDAEESVKVPSAEGDPALRILSQPRAED